MVPELDLQLQAVIKALGDTVMPALDPAQRVAVEQLGLSIATLGMVRSRIGLAGRREWQELQNAVSLGEAVAAESGSNALSAPLAEGIAALEDANPLPYARTRATRAITAAVSKLVAGGATPAVMRTIVDHSKAATDLSRAWSLPAGFEPDPGEVPALETLLGLDN